MIRLDYLINNGLMIGKEKLKIKIAGFINNL